MKAELKYEELTGKIGLRRQAEVEKDVYYEEHFVGKRRLDLIVEELVWVELKAVSEPDGASYSKMVNYLKVFKMEVGLLLNFGTPSLQF